MKRKINPDTDRKLKIFIDIYKNEDETKKI